MNARIVVMLVSCVVLATVLAGCTPTEDGADPVSEPLYDYENPGDGPRETRPEVPPVEQVPNNSQNTTSS